ncbi:DNA primase small subunit [Neodiprion pinetum]|uniref:DNA primase small subunit n=1 Tax=Neodiprion pinetum TaxID=441929 RepID=UPI001ED8E254|nr:DNA primase small subunit isoform X1 [Neodiprion fabricii]XP_046468328.1 DNA primase small subunit isoform X1 [Neodiprion pinetum]XP_046604299.1 DNA primase small subunit isoform X1 [Neodiprion virginianus]
MSTEGIENLIDLLPLYYQRLFPFHDYYRWLSYGDPSVFSRREFSFTVRDDVYIRYRSFVNQDELQLECRRLLPFKIDIGAIYNICPKDEKKFSSFLPVERELVFDIDMTDYDDVRSCCSGADICTKCWKYMVIACQILDSALREDFGFEHLLWVFSGRRGIHCWVCDKSARELNSMTRGCVAEYLQLITGGELKAKKVNFPGPKLHHSVRRALNIIEPLFVSMCVEEQNMLGTEEGVAKFLPLILDDSLRSQVKDLFKKHTSSVERWEAFTACYQVEKQTGKKWRLNHLLEEIMIQYAYPRLDINVTKGMNHLLKSPFCIHPKSGKVSVPFSPKAVGKFNPLTVPTINLLIEEINAFDAKEDSIQESNTRRKIKDYKKTSLNKSVHVFQEFLRNLEDASKGQKILQSDMLMEF